MTTCNKWDMVLVRFPFSAENATKKRPALIVSPAPYHASGHYVILFVSSNSAAAENGLDYRLQDWQSAGLSKPSYVRMKFATINKEVVLQKIGHLSDVDAANLQRNL